MQLGRLKVLLVRNPVDIFFVRSNTSTTFFKVASVEEKPLTGEDAFIGLLRRPRVELETERYRPICENLTIGSASKMTGVDVKRPFDD
jgi:hypothetical protein